MLESASDGAALKSNPLTSTPVSNPNKAQPFAKLDFGGLLTLVCCLFPISVSRSFSASPPGGSVTQQMAQQLKAHTTLLEDLNLFSRTLMAGGSVTGTCNFSFRVFRPSYILRHTLYIPTSTHTYINKNKKVNIV